MDFLLPQRKHSGSGMGNCSQPKHLIIHTFCYTALIFLSLLLIGCSQIELKSPDHPPVRHSRSQVPVSFEVLNSVSQANLGSLYFLIVPVVQVSSSSLESFAKDAAAFLAPKYGLTIEPAIHSEKKIELEITSASISVLDFIVLRKVKMQVGYSMKLVQDGEVCWYAAKSISHSELQSLPNQTALSSLLWQLHLDTLGTLFQESLVNCESFAMDKV